MTQELDDFFETGSGGAPGMTWDGIKAPAVFRGVIVPRDAENLDAAYETVQMTDIKTAAPLFWKQKGDPGPWFITESKSNGIENRAATQAVFTVQLQEFTPMQWMTDKAIERAQQDEEFQDVGLRRFFLRGSTASKSFRESLKKAGLRKPEIGGILEVELLKREANDHGGKTNIVDARYIKPTAASLAVAAKRATELRDSAPTDEGDDQEPPF